MPSNSVFAWWWCHLLTLKLKTTMFYVWWKRSDKTKETRWTLESQELCQSQNWTYVEFSVIRQDYKGETLLLENLCIEGAGGSIWWGIPSPCPFDYTIEPDISGQGLLMGQFAFYLFGFRPEWCHSYSWQCWPFNTSRQLTLPPPPSPRPPNLPHSTSLFLLFGCWSFRWAWRSL